MASGTLYMIPVPLAEQDPAVSLPEGVLSQTRTLRCFIAENAKSARRFLKQLGMEQSQLQVLEMDKHRPGADVTELLQPLLQGNDTGLLSEAGMPGVADPGALYAAEAHRLGIRVVALPGPSSLLLALSASGLNGQQFCFHGYLPKQKEELRARIQLMEKNSARYNQSQIFIETPYRNEGLLKELLECLMPGTRLHLSAGLTTPAGFSVTLTVKQWKQSGMPAIKDVPVVFILQA